MPARNVEIKAHLEDAETVAKRVKALGADGPRLLLQHDTFFRTPKGRLKLRRLAGSEKSGELIFYERPDARGPKTSHYVITPSEDCVGLDDALTRAYGRCGVVAKERRLFLFGRTRIHLDRVEGLGDFLELEVVLAPDEEPEAGQLEARQLLRDLRVPESALIEGAYVDLLERVRNHG